MALRTQLPVLLKRLLRTERTATTQPVKRSIASYMQERGWHFRIGWRGLGWEGYYRTRLGSFKGKIVPSLPPKFFVKHPPEGLSRHSHHMCFTDTKSGGWWSVHYLKQPKDLDSGVIALERIFHEAVLLSKKTG